MADVLIKGSVSGPHREWHRRRDTREGIESRLIFSVCFLVFLLAGIFERVLPRSWRSASRDPNAPRSLVEQAWGAAGTCTAYAFKG